MRTMASTSYVDMAPVPTHFVVFFNPMAASRTASVSSGASRPSTACSYVSMASRRSVMRARSATSWVVDLRYSPVRGSITMMPALKLVNPTRPPSRTMSFSGTRPARRTLAGAARTASSTTCGGIFTVLVSRSTWQPASAITSSASSLSTNTPVRSRTSSVPRWMSSRSASLKTSRRSPAWRRTPAWGFRFTRPAPFSVTPCAGGYHARAARDDPCASCREDPHGRDSGVHSRRAIKSGGSRTAPSRAARRRCGRNHRPVPAGARGRDEVARRLANLLPHFAVGARRLDDRELVTHGLLIVRDGAPPGDVRSAAMHTCAHT